MKGIWKCSILILAGVVVAASFVAGAYAEEQGYREHTVSRGETLWDISGKEISDPFLWPKVWKENPVIKNPDRIYPGQKIKIPLYLLQKEVSPKPIERAMPEEKPEVREEPKKEELKAIRPVEKKFLVDRETLISSGYIADTVANVGRIAGVPTEATSIGRGDYAYITTTRPAQKGEKFYIIRSWGKVRHPATGAMMGYLIDVVGIAEVVGLESGQTKARVTSSFSEVTVGDLLDDYYEIERPFLTEAPRSFDVPGFIVATRQRVGQNALFDIVYVDKGRRDGVEIGDLMGTISRNAYDIPNGVIQVISTREKTATAIVRKSEREVVEGDRTGPLPSSK